MDEKKQIEEMAWDMCDIPKHPSITSCEKCNCYGKCQAMYYAKRAYNADYRKQEWISVDERLPEVGDDYLIVLKEKYEWEKEWRYHVDVATFIFTWECIFNDWDEGQEIHITHWMPLPEPPKMKGGAE